MQGTILTFDPATGEGIVLDAEGKRLRFDAGDWKSPGAPRLGATVDFTPAGDHAAEILLLPGGAGAGAESSALMLGIFSFICAIASFFVGQLGLVTLLAAAILGILGLRAGRDLADRRGYQLSRAGLAVAAAYLVFIAVATTIGLRMLRSPPEKNRAISVDLDIVQPEPNDGNGGQ
ncbi:MAG TPA: hypothetical protein VD887_09080 [Allosphingosinicella sp.]|nr:hypothetical protein [Allosphingosinicella sp.]